jgi:transcriptional regulator with XRE-family HTH domain
LLLHGSLGAPNPEQRFRGSRRAQEEDSVSESLAQRIDRLFRTHLSPRGKEYSYRQVAAAIGRNGAGVDQGEAVSATYIWALRTGVKTNPTMRHLQALARFFEVSPSYFFDEELTGFACEETRLLAASGNEALHGIAAASLGLSDESLIAALSLLRRLRNLEGLPSG